MAKIFSKPFDGAISKLFDGDFPKPMRQAIRSAKKSEILSPSYPYRARMARKAYDAAYAALQIELVKMQSWATETGERIAIVFEGRDAAGKGGTIKRFRENLNPRGARVVALPKPSDFEQSQWYFQRYISHLPAKGTIAFFDRSWYNRGVVERVFGFSTEEERELFFQQTPKFEEMLVKDGIRLFKIWLTVGRAEQMRRFLSRESDPLKQWKLSEIDVKSLRRWNDYSVAIEDMFARTHTSATPWNVIRADDKRRARLEAMRLVLSALPYRHRDDDAVLVADPKLTGCPELIVESAR